MSNESMNYRAHYTEEQMAELGDIVLNVFTIEDMQKCFHAGVKFARDMENNPSNSEYINSLINLSEIKICVLRTSKNYKEINSALNTIKRPWHKNDFDTQSYYGYWGYAHFPILPWGTHLSDKPEYELGYRLVSSAEEFISTIKK